MLVTEWEQLVGKTVEMVEEDPFGDCLLVFEDGDYAHIGGSGEEYHGAHWPVLCEEDLGLVAEHVVAEWVREPEETLLETAKRLDDNADFAEWVASLSVEELKDLWIQGVIAMMDVLKEMIGGARWQSI